MKLRSMPPKALAAIVLLLNTRGSCAGLDSRASQTEYSLRALDAGVFFFQSTHGRLPEQLGDVCDAEPRWCALSPADIWTTDGWGTPIRYRPGDETYVLISAGRDRTFETGDDILFDAALNRSWAAGLSGCYPTSKTLPRLGADTVKLLPDVAPGGGYHVQHPRDLDGYPAYLAKWYPLSADSFLITWVHADRGITLRGRVSGSELEGRIGGRSIAGRKINC